MYTLGAMLRGWSRTLAASMTLAVVAVLLAGAVTSASAHVRPASTVEAFEPLIDTPIDASTGATLSPARSAGSVPPAAASLGLTFVLTLVLGLGIVAPRRALVLALVLVLGVLAVETGVHSVHHLADRQAAAECAVAWATAHVPGATQPTAPDATWVPTPLGAVPLPTVDRPGRRSSRPGEGRAPPVA
jgi:hypothetical protein